MYKRQLHARAAGEVREFAAAYHLRGVHGGEHIVARGVERHAGVAARVGERAGAEGRGGIGAIGLAWAVGDDLLAGRGAPDIGIVLKGGGRRLDIDREGLALDGIQLAAVRGVE